MLISGLATRLVHQRDQLADIVIVHRMHGGEVRASDAPMQPEALRLIGEALDMARQRIVGFIAMHIDQETAPRSDLA